MREGAEPLDSRDMPSTLELEDCNSVSREFPGKALVVNKGEGALATRCGSVWAFIRWVAAK